MPDPSKHSPHAAEPASGPEAASGPIGLDPRVAAMVPSGLLQDGEIILLFIKPSLWMILLNRLGNLLTTLLIFAAAYFVNDALGNQLSERELLLLCIAVVGMLLFWGFFEWLSQVYLLTDRRVITLSGVLRVFVFQAPLEKIQHTRLAFSLRERFLGLGTIGFATSGTAYDESFWLMLPRPLEVHQQVLDALNRYRR